MKELSIVISGEAGQGLKTLEDFIIKALRKNGIFFFSTSELMSRVRGGNNTTEIRISEKPVNSYVDKIDILISLSPNGTDRLTKRIDKNTLIIGEKEFINKEITSKIFDIPISEIIKKVGGKLYTNTVFLGVILKLLSIKKSLGEELLKEAFSDKKEILLNKNLNALSTGYELVEEHEISLKYDKEITKSKVVLSGNDAIGIGALSGGANFMSSYPMSPGTGVLTFFAKNSNRFNLVVEQAEDEIAAINMAIGAWYAGGRGFVTTSGGGYALMEEGISLSGITETPVVVHVAQRPGPATGLPTRTEQGDLLFTVFSGHGEFPKVVFAPGTVEEALELGNKAFNIADKYGIPVIILSDQYFLDSHYLANKPDIKNYKMESHFIKTDTNYKTYAYTNSGKSPRGIPSFGEGYVCCDSDEHDEYGRITEDAEVRVKMMDKRMKKIESFRKDEIKPTIFGSDNYETLVIGWGTTHHAILEALDEINDKKISYLHFKQVFPIPKATEKYLKKAKKIIVVENNATGQFSKLLRMETGYTANKNVLQYNGFPFSVEYLIKELKQ